MLGVISQIRNTEQPFLSSSVSECDCIVVNATSSLIESPDATDVDDAWFDWIFRVSYMYYSMIGTLLTVFFGLLISKLADMFTQNQILKITSLHDVHKDHGFGFRTPAHFSVASFTIATGRKVSSFIHHVAHDVSQSTLKVESKLMEVISHKNLLHLHLHSDAEDRISILNEETSPCLDEPVHMEAGSRKMFFIGHHDDDEYEARSRRGSNSECLLSDVHSRRHHK